MYNSKGPTGKKPSKAPKGFVSKAAPFTKNDKMDVLKGKAKPKGKK